jgi:hypothetical protein
MLSNWIVGPLDKKRANEGWRRYFPRLGPKPRKLSITTQHQLKIQTDQSCTRVGESRTSRDECRRGGWRTREWRRVASSGVKNSGTTENEWGEGASVLEDSRGTLECSEAVSRQKNTREAECLGEDTRLVCITGYRSKWREKQLERDPRRGIQGRKKRKRASRKHSRGEISKEKAREKIEGKEQSAA